METKADDLSCFEVNDVARCLRVSRAQLYELIKNDRRLKPIKLGARSIWTRQIIVEYLDAKSAERAA